MTLTKKEEIEQLRAQVRALGNSEMSGDEALALVEDMVPMVLGDITEDPDDAMIHVLIEIPVHQRNRPACLK